MPKSTSLITPIGSNMTDAAYPFRGVYKVKSVLSHGHGGAPTARLGATQTTSLTLKITGNNLRIEEMYVPPSQALNCELSVDNSLPRKLKLRKSDENLCLTVPSDGRTYNLTAVIKHINNNNHNNNNNSYNSIKDVKYNNNVESNGIRIADVNSYSSNTYTCKGANKHFCHLILQSYAQEEKNTIRKHAPYTDNTEINETREWPDKNEIDVSNERKANMLFVPVRVLLNKGNTNSKGIINDNINEENIVARLRFIVDGIVLEPVNGCYYLPTDTHECLLEILPEAAELAINKMQIPQPAINVNSTSSGPSFINTEENLHYITVQTILENNIGGKNVNNGGGDNNKILLECPALYSPTSILSTQASNVTGKLIELSSLSPSLVPIYNGVYKLHVPATAKYADQQREPEEKYKQDDKQMPNHLLDGKSEMVKPSSLLLPDNKLYCTNTTEPTMLPDIETQLEELNDGTRSFIVNAAGLYITLTVTSPELKTITGMHSARLALPNYDYDSNDTTSKQEMSKGILNTNSQERSDNTNMYTSSTPMMQRVTMTLTDVQGHIKLRQTHCLPLHRKTSKSNATPPVDRTNLTDAPSTSPPFVPSLTVPVPPTWSVPVAPLPPTPLPPSQIPNNPIALRWDEAPATRISENNRSISALPNSTTHSSVHLYANDGTFLTCHYSNNNNCSTNNNVSWVNGPDGLCIDRSQHAHITVRQVIDNATSAASNTSSTTTTTTTNVTTTNNKNNTTSTVVTFDISPTPQMQITQQANATNTKTTPNWIASLAHALQAPTVDEAKQQIEAINTEGDLEAMCIVGFAKEQLCRPLPKLSFAVERDGLHGVSCPGYIVTPEMLPATTTNTSSNAIYPNTNANAATPVENSFDLLHHIPADANGNAYFTVKTHRHGRSLTACQVHVPLSQVTEQRVSEEQVLDSQLVFALTHILQSRYSSHHVNLLIEEIKRLASTLLSANGSKLIDYLQRTLQQMNTTTLSPTAINNSSSNDSNNNQEIFVTCNCTGQIGFSDIYTLHPEYTITAFINTRRNSSNNNISNSNELNSDVCDNEVGVGRSYAIAQHGQLLLSQESSNTSNSTRHRIIFVAHDPVTHEMKSKLQITLGNNNLAPNLCIQNLSSNKREKLLHSSENEISIPYVDVFMRYYEDKVQVRLLAPADMRLIYTVDGQNAITGSIDVQIELTASHSHHLELSLLNKYGSIVFQQKLTIPWHIVPSYGITLSENGLIIEPDKSFELMYTIDNNSNNNNSRNNELTRKLQSVEAMQKRQELQVNSFEPVTNNLILMNNTSEHDVVLRKRDWASHTNYPGEVRFCIPQWLSWDAVNVLVTIARLLTRQEHTWNVAEEQLLNYIKDDVNASPLRELASIMLQLIVNLRRGNAEKDNRKRSGKVTANAETLLQPGVRLLQHDPASEQSRVYFRLTGVD